jgi:hypothetical protein
MLMGSNLVSFCKRYSCEKHQDIRAHKDKPLKFGREGGTDGQGVITCGEYNVLRVFVISQLRT